MDSKKLVKVIKTIVEAEVAKKHEAFLTKTFPKILEEEVSRRINNMSNKEDLSLSTISEEVDPFTKVDEILKKEREKTPQKKFTRNEKINEVLNNTKPFTKEQRSGGGGAKSVLDNLPQQPVNEGLDKTDNFDSTDVAMGGGVPPNLQHSMAAKMGYGNLPTQGSKQGGLGVQTGLPGLDRILNRDNSALVKKFKR